MGCGVTQRLSVSFSGSGIQDISWTSSPQGLSLSPGGADCFVTAPSSVQGSQSFTVTASHPDAEYPVSFLVVVSENASSQSAAPSASKAIWTYTSNHSATVGGSVTLRLESSGLSSSDRPSWNVTSGSSAVSLSTSDTNLTASVSAVAEGRAVVKASLSGCQDVYFVITVSSPSSSQSSSIHTDSYLSTNSNVVYFEESGISKNISVTLYNGDDTSYSQLSCRLSNSFFDVVSNGNSITVTSLHSDASATLTVTHPQSKNELVIYLHSGNRYSYKNEAVCYITSSTDVLELKSGQEEVSIAASLNYIDRAENDSVLKGFDFTCDNTDIASISYVNYSNICYVKPLRNGITKIHITHPDSSFSKEVIVIVNSPDSSSSSVPYITTDTNVITLVKGSYETVSVSLKNIVSADKSMWKWESDDSRIADVIAENGTTAMISANGEGTIQIHVSHALCEHSLSIVVVVLSSASLNKKPYITTDKNIITMKKGETVTLNAQIISGNGASDSNYFKFTSNTPTLLFVTSSSGAASLKALNTGMTYVTVTNTRYSKSYAKTVLVIIEDSYEEGLYIKPSQSILKFRPDDTSLSIISAELVNGNPVDGADFVWWADDYNMIALNSVADQCSVMPLGRSGSTKIHVSHVKSEKQAEILVIISSYDNFAFSSNFITIEPEKLCFIPLHVPQTSDNYTVSYSSSDEDICIVKGSDSVAWICGLSYGTSSVTARMMNGNSLLAEAQMLVNVTYTDPAKPVISLSNSIITVEAGTGQLIKAGISGYNIDSSEASNLKWSIKDNKNGISFLNEGPDRTVSGPEVYVNFDIGGEYVIVCEHESGTYDELYIIVKEKGDVSIELSTYLESVYMDDGSFTITATLINSSEQDYKKIQWSAVKQKGVNVVSVSKAKGQTCTVVPKHTGQTTVIARLPSGQYRECTVIVKASSEINIEVGSVRVIPGYTETVNYTTTPPDATVNWYTLMSSSGSSLSGAAGYFSVEDDPAKHQLRITGLNECASGAAGTVTATMLGASASSMPSLTVYVNYEMEIRCDDINGTRLTQLVNNKPDTNHPVDFNIVYFPSDMDIDLTCRSSTVSCLSANSGHQENPVSEFSVGNIIKSTVIEGGRTKGKLTVSLIPHAETQLNLGVSGSIKGSDSLSRSVKDSFTYSAFYSDDYSIQISPLIKAGSFSEIKYDSDGKIDSISLGDGEDIPFVISILEENASGRIVDIEWVSSDPQNKEFSLNNNLFTSETRDRKTLYKKIFGGNGSYSDLMRMWNSSGSYYKRTEPDSSVKPVNGVMGVWSDTEPGTGRKVWHIAHGWDYYKDLPEDISANGVDSWKAYINANAWGNDSFITDLENKGVDWWSVTKEPYYSYGGNKYTFFPHQNNSYYISYSCYDVEYTDYSDMYLYETSYKAKNGNLNNLPHINSMAFSQGCVELTNNYYYSIPHATVYLRIGGFNQSCYTFINDTHDRDFPGRILKGLGFLSYTNILSESTGIKNRFVTDDKNYNINIEMTKPSNATDEKKRDTVFMSDMGIGSQGCDPFIVDSTCIKNTFPVIFPFTTLTAKHCGGLSLDGYGSWCRYSYPKFNPLFADSIMPCVSKDSSNHSFPAGTLKVKYVDGHGDTKTLERSIPVTLVKRYCESYSSNQWKKTSIQGVNQFVMEGN